LIKRFADEANKKAGEFYTPRAIVRLMVNILDPKAGERIHDPACGKCPGIEPVALIHSAELDTLGYLVNGLGQINRYAFHRTSPSEQSPRCYKKMWCRSNPP